MQSFYENDTDFGQLYVIPSTLSQPSTVVLPSEKIDLASISHLSRDQQLELLEVLDRYRSVFQMYRFRVILMLLLTPSR